MSAAKQATRPLHAWVCRSRAYALQARSFASTSVETHVHPPPPPPTPIIAVKLDPNTVSTRRDERKLIKSGLHPIGSRRRRAALAQSPNIPFEQLPYQCFQEALKVLKADREEKVAAIEAQRARIVILEAQDPVASGGERAKSVRLASMRCRLEKLKILADINDPVVKKRFEDGKGDMNKPIYRLLAETKWREYRQKVVEQRITQMHVIPDVLPAIRQEVDVSISFGKHKVQPGALVASETSEMTPAIKVQVFDKGERLVSVVVIDADVPNVEKDGFDYRCHYAAVNIPVSPSKPRVSLETLSADTQVVLPWLPPFAQRGSPYHRYSVFALEQPEGKVLDVAALATKTRRDGFILRSFIDRHRLRAVGINLFRAVWDETTDAVMQRAGIDGADVEFKRNKPEKLPYKKKDGSRYR